MAKIEMDLSEFKIMEENKKLLEQALEREKSLNDQISVLNAEKIKVLEDAKMKVVKIIKTENRSLVLIKRPPIEAFRELARLYGVIVPHDFNNGVNSASYQSYIDAFFTESETVSFPEETVTTHGLDDVKKELKENLNQTLDKEVKDKLKYLVQLQEDFSQASDEIKKLRSENKQQSVAIENMNKEHDKLVKDFQETKSLLSSCKEGAKNLDAFEKDSKILSEIKEVLQTGYSFWNKRYLLDRIKNMIFKI